MEHTKSEKTIELVDRARKLIEKVSETLTEIESLQNDQPTPGADVKRLFHFFAARWSGRYANAYVFSSGKDAGGFKRLLKTMPRPEIERRISNYLDTEEPFLVRHRHPLSLFFSNVNAYGDTPWGGTVARPMGCEHEPPCTTDAEHTARKLQDVRGGRS